MRSQDSRLLSRFATMSICLLVASGTVARAEQPYQVDWVKQFGTTQSDYGEAVAINPQGNAVVVGYTHAGISGTDQLRVVYDPTGDRLFYTQIKTDGSYTDRAVAYDGAGNMLVSGTMPGWPDGNHPGQTDIYLFNGGSESWTHQIGTLKNEVALAVAGDHDGNVFVGGYTEGDFIGTNAGGWDALIMKYDASGNVTWAKQLGAGSYDTVRSMTVDEAGNLYVAGQGYLFPGETYPGGGDAFLMKYDPAGTLLWHRAIGSIADEEAYAVALDNEGNAFISGVTGYNAAGPFVGGGSDSFLMKYDSDGTRLWARQVGSFGSDEKAVVAVDGAGNAYLAGWTSGDLGGDNAGEGDVFLTKFDPSGLRLWSQQFGSVEYDFVNGIAADDAGNVYITGRTAGVLDRRHYGGAYDAFLAKLVPSGPGDLDGSGYVGLDDLNIVLAEWNQFVTEPGSTRADPSGDGFVGLEDLDIVLNNWGAGTPPSSTANIPEPAGAALMLIGSLAMLRRAR